MLKKHNDAAKQLLSVLSVVVFGFFLRLSMMWWDEGFHLHPDERMLIMVAEKISFFNALNPHFFSYGTLPIYILKIVGDVFTNITTTPFNTYDGLLPIGRGISSLIEAVTITGVYFLTKEIFHKNKMALAASLLYTIAFFPIQNAHFFIVDVFVNASTVFLLLVLIKHYQKPHVKTLILTAILSAIGVTSKFTFLVFLPLVGLVLLFSKSKHEHIAQHLLKLLIFPVVFLLFSFLCMPYMFLDSDTFAKDIFFQLRMNSDAYAFPYTLQYVTTLPYLYHLKNIFLWGLGPIISTLSFAGLIALTFLIANKGIHKQNKTKIALFLVWYVVYFVFLGRSAVKFMRYMLPMYPFLTICASFFIYTVQKHLKHSKIGLIFVASIIILSAYWTWGFLNIYRTRHTRLQATEWINKNITPGSVIAVEHWDDLLPLTNSVNYRFAELPLYNTPDNKNKWQYINSLLQQSDYVVIASNRLYTPLIKLRDCEKHSTCYPNTAQYYEELFAGKRGFKKVAKFASYPQWNFFGFKIELPDEVADESFTVYDHPKVMIFKKIR